MSRSSYTETRLDTEEFAQSTFCTETFLNRSSCTETLFRHRRVCTEQFYTKTLLHPEILTQRAIFTKPISREKVARETCYRFFWRCTRISCWRVAQISHILDDGHARSLRILPPFRVSKAFVPPAPAVLREDHRRSGKTVIRRCLKVFFTQLFMPVSMCTCLYTRMFRGCFQTVAATCLV